MRFLHRPRGPGGASMSLRAGDLRWQTGASRWSKVRTLVITDDAGQRRRLAERRDTVAVGTLIVLVHSALADRLARATAIEVHDPRSRRPGLRRVTWPRPAPGRRAYGHRR